MIRKIRNVFANGSSANIKISKTLLSKMIQSGGFLLELIAAIQQAIFMTGKKYQEKVYH